jgi:cytochrome b
MAKKRRRTAGLNPVRVWDLPTRLFHWLLVALVATSFATGKAGGNAMRYHELSGLGILALLGFRLAWGLIGSRPSRFAHFLAGPATVARYAAGLLRRDSPAHLGHNPLGGWSVALMLAALLVQAGTGLFANDDIATAGPLANLVSKAASDRLTSVHHLNHEVILVLVAVHLGAVLFHLVFRRENLITPMLTGVKPWRGKAPPLQEPSLWLAAAVAALAALGVWLLAR